LSITKKLVDMMGGQLCVKSTVDKGSKFWMVLDLPEMSTQTIPEIVQESLIIGYRHAMLVPSEKLKILVVDDTWENRLVLVKLLTPLGFEVTEASSGRGSINRACAVRPHVILMDLVMPDMDGFAATRHLRRAPELKETIIVAISASAFGYHKQQSLAAGCDDFIAKPIHAGVLLACLQKHLKLTWIYDSKVPVDSYPLAGGDCTEQPFLLPNDHLLTREQATILFDLTLRGDINGIVEYVEQLEQSDESLQKMTATLKQLAKYLKIKQIREIARQYL